MRRFTRYFMEGLLFLTPVVVTIYVVYLVFSKVDGLFTFRIPGFGFLLTIAIITLIGLMTSNFLTRWLTGIIDRVFKKLPLVKMVYTSVRDLVGAFVGDKKKGFNRPVMVEIIPGGGVCVMGFMTSDDLTDLGIKDKVAVHLPQTFNYAGNLLIVPASSITPIDAESGEVMAFIVSGGISS